jgi:hypothetical protein
LIELRQRWAGAVSRATVSAVPICNRSVVVELLYEPSVR